MVSVILSENSSVGRMLLRRLATRTEITRNDSASVPLKFALGGLSSSDLVFTFEETDREQIMGISDRFLEMAFRELGKDLGTREDLCSILLPPKVTPKKTLTNRKSSLKKDKDAPLK